MSLNLREEFKRATGLMETGIAAMAVSSILIAGMIGIEIFDKGPFDALSAFTVAAGIGGGILGIINGQRLRKNGMAIMEAAIQAAEEERRNPPDMFKLPEGMPPKQPK